MYFEWWVGVPLYEVVILIRKKIWLRGISCSTNCRFWIKWICLHVEHLMWIGLYMWLNRTRNDTSANRCNWLVNVCVIK